MHARKYGRGFTLMELLVALAVLGLVFGIALPSYRAIVDGARMESARSSLLNSLRSGMVHAGARAVRVVFCPSLDGETCTGGTEWTDGWIAFRDINANRERDPGEGLLGYSQALPHGVRLTTSVGRPKIVLQNYGGNPGSNVTFVLCGTRGPAKAQTIVLSNQGRFRYGKPTSAQVEGRCPS